MPKYRVFFTAMKDMEVIVEAEDKIQAGRKVKAKDFELSTAEDSIEDYYVFSTAYAEDVL